MKTTLTPDEKHLALVSITNAQVALAKLQSEIMFDFNDGRIAYRDDLVAYAAARYADSVSMHMRVIQEVLGT